MIKNCFNYVGSKDRLFQSIDKNLDRSKNNFVDLFCGSGVVGVNEINNYDRVILNDACWQMTETLKYLAAVEYEDVIDSINNVIGTFKLSKTNKEGYLELREFYNNASNTIETFNPVIFYCLLTHSFNYNIHINSSGGFSVPFGNNRSYFNPSLQKKLEIFQRAIHSNKDNISIRNLSFDVLTRSIKNIIKDSMFYCDPPYFSSDSSYERIHYIGKWDETKERLLYSTLDYIHENGGSFLLSNVVENNGETNTILTAWAKKYTMIDVSSDFSNCNYQRKNLGKTKEVLIRNY